MRAALTSLIVSTGLACGACAGPEGGLHIGGSAGSGPGLWYETEPGWNRGPLRGLPGYGLDPWRRSDVACDAFGRCWRLDATDRLGFARGWHDDDLPSARPPRWAKALPDRLRDSDRFVRPGSNLVCDRASRICYKRGNLDKSVTRGVFGKRAANRADDLRDRLGTGRLFVPQRDVACDQGRRVCFEDGVPDRKLTRRYFGREAPEGRRKGRRDREQES